MAAANLSAGPALLAVRRAVVANLADLQPSQLVLVACSGGPDSLALAAGAAISGHDVGAAVIDHALQAGSNETARVAAEQCRSLGLNPVVVKRVEVGSNGGPEASARAARYRGLREVCAESGAAALLLGHTLDDQAETVLLRLARGSGARSLSAMAPIDGELRRPLLSLRREQVRVACAEALLQAHQDPHNADDRYARARLRHHGLRALVDDLGGGVVLGLARSATLLRDDNEALDQWADGVALVDQAHSVIVPADGLQSLPAAVRQRVIRRMALSAGSPGASLTRDHVLAVAALVTDWRGQGPVDLPGGVRASRKSDSLVMHLGSGRKSAR